MEFIKGDFYSRAKMKNILPSVTTYEILKANSESRKPIELLLPYNERLRDFCRNSLQKDIAMIEVQIEGQSYIRMRQSLRKTLGDNFGELGGTLGLFTGFSFMAIVELIYWILVTLQRIFKEAIPDPNRFRRT